MDQETSILELKEKIKKLCEERDWDQYHGAKDLAIGVITEASELLEHFRFKDEKQTEEMFDNPDKKQEIEEEMADILWFLFRLAQKYNIDLSEAFEKKLVKFKEKYPVEKSKSSNKKYDEL